MKCIHLNIRGAVFIVLIFFLNGVKQSQLTDNRMDLSTKDSIQKASKNEDTIIGKAIEDVSIPCPSTKNCSDLNYPCINCTLNPNCIYGEELNTTCRPRREVACHGPKEFTRTFICRYCYQTEQWEHSCILKSNCNSVDTPRQYYRTNCSVRNDIICLGQRTFYKKVLCNWTGGYRWSTALILSITLGGFGADRFYLGHWQEGIGKLFSFGGLGVWTLIDVILISLHYLGPADGSLYLY